jgi:uncharacterized protein (DUF427 family)
MKATLNGNIVASSADTIECAGYHYFPSASVRLDWLEKSPKTESDLACPHSVRFYDVVIDGTRHERAAWSYEAPREALKHIGGLFGFWKDVKVS